MPGRKQLCRGAVAGLVCAMVCCCLNSLPWIQALEDWALDSSFVIRGRRPTDSRVIIIGLDDTDLEDIQKPLMFISPELAQVVTYASERGAASIGVDILLADRDKGTLVELQPGGLGDAQTMGMAVGRAGNVILPLWDVGKAKPILPIFEWDTDQFSGRWNRLGFVNLTVDADAHLRRQRLRVRGRDTLQGEDVVVPCLALAAFAEAYGAPDDWLSPDEALQLDGRPIPIDSAGALLVNYVGPPGSFPCVSFGEVLQAARTGQSLPVDFRGATVLVGVTASLGRDMHATPFLARSMAHTLLSAGHGADQRLMAGIEVHANIVATLADRAFITTPWWVSTPLLLALFGLALGMLFWRVNLETGALCMLGHHVAWRLLCVAAFSYANWRIEMVSMLILGFLLYGAVFALRWRWLRRMMGMVKSEAIARALEAGGSLELKGEEREITVLFSDIRDFTSFSESHRPGQVVELLNAYFTAVVPAIERHGGAINLYIGDGLMVVFNAPERQADHAIQALRAALAVVGRVHQLRDQWARLDAADFRIGIGIHTGTAVLGTVGSPNRLDYTAIGDTVNTAARIESANKELKTEILISQSTRSAIGAVDLEAIAVSLEPHRVSVKGKREPIEVYSAAAVATSSCARSDQEEPVE